MLLGLYEEFVGTLAQVKESPELTILEFHVTTPVEIPVNSVNMTKLKELVGQRIGVLRTDREIRIRKIK